MVLLYLLRAWLFNAVNSWIREGAYHEVALDIGQLLGQTLLRRIVCCALNLIVIVVQTDDVGASELGNLTGRSTDTATNIKYRHALLDADLVGQVVLVAGNGLTEGLADGEAAEVEGLAPSKLVDVGGEVIVAAWKGRHVSVEMCKVGDRNVGGIGHSLSCQGSVLVGSCLHSSK